MRWVSPGRAMTAVSSSFGPRAKQVWVERQGQGVSFATINNLMGSYDPVGMR